MIAPLIEGSTEPREAILSKITEKIESINMPETLRQYLKEPEELLNACCIRTENLSGKLMHALNNMSGVDASNFPQQTWKMKIVEMLEPKFKSADIKKTRQKRRSYITKVELLVSLISSIE